MYELIKKRFWIFWILIVVVLLILLSNNLEAQDLPEVYIVDSGDTLAVMYSTEDEITVDLPGDKLHDLKIKKVHSEEYKDHFLRPIQIGIGVLLGYIIINEIHKRQMFKQIKGWQK